MGNSKISLICGDCLVEMPKIDSGSIDMVLADVPYGTTACKWDSVIPFEPMWAQLKRIVKPNGAICLFGSEPFSSALRMSNIKMFKYDWYWKKTPSGHLNAKIQPMRCMEHISIFTEKSFYYPQFTKGKPYKQKSGRGSDNYGKQIRVITENDGRRYPIQLLDFKNEKGLHPTQKPVALLEYLIKTYTLECETVLDFTMGSGSTGVACKNINRNQQSHSTALK